MCALYSCWMDGYPDMPGLLEEIRRQARRRSGFLCTHDCQLRAAPPTRAARHGGAPALITIFTVSLAVRALPACIDTLASLDVGIAAQCTAMAPAGLTVASIWAIATQAPTYWSGHERKSGVHQKAVWCCHPDGGCSVNRGNHPGRNDRRNVFWTLRGYIRTWVNHADGEVI
jgi:hypothetical protein